MVTCLRFDHKDEMGRVCKACYDLTRTERDEYRDKARLYDVANKATVTITHELTKAEAECKELKRKLHETIRADAVIAMQNRGLRQALNELSKLASPALDEMERCGECSPPSGKTHQDGCPFVEAKKEADRAAAFTPIKAEKRIAALKEVTRQANDSHTPRHWRPCNVCDALKALDAAEKEA